MKNSGNMRSIWDNDFYNNPPALAWTYKLVFNDFINFNINGSNNTSSSYLSDEDMEILNKASVSVNIGERKIEHVDLYFGGLKFKKLTRVDNTGTFTVKFNEDSKRSVSHVLEKIYAVTGNSKNYYFDINGAAYMSDLTPANSQDNEKNKTNKYKNLKNNIISVKIFDHNETLDIDNNTTCYRQYKFYGCKYLGMENIEFSYESTDTQTRNATFAYDWMEYNVAYDEREVY